MSAPIQASGVVDAALFAGHGAEALAGDGAVDEERGTVPVRELASREVARQRAVGDDVGGEAGDDVLVADGGFRRGGAIERRDRRVRCARREQRRGCAGGVETGRVRELRAAHLEGLLRAHGVLEDPAEERRAARFDDLARRALGGQAGELAREAHLVDVAVAGEEDDALAVALLRVQEGRHDAARPRAAIDRVAAEDERRAVREDQAIAVEGDGGVVAREVLDLEPDPFDVGEVRDEAHGAATRAGGA